LILQGEASSSSTQKDKISPQATRKIKLRRVFERKFSDFIIQLLPFYIISKPIYRREILVEKVNLLLIEKVNIILVEKVNLILRVK
jgi:hypothetical protein